MALSTIFIDALTKRVILRKIFVQKIKFEVQLRIYDCIAPAGTTYLDCHFANLICLVFFSNFNLQHVLETVWKLNERITGHKTGFRNPSKHRNCQILCKHFTFKTCNGAKYQTPIIEKLPGNRRTNRGSMDPSSKKNQGS